MRDSTPWCRHLGQRATQRGALGLLAGLTGLGLREAAGKRRRRATRKRRGEGQAGVEITNGTRDGNGHPDVGLMSAHDKNGNHLWRGSGTLIWPRLFLTAGHCTDTKSGE